MLIFIKLSWPPEYFDVCIYEHAVCQKKEPSLQNLFYSSFMHSFFNNTWM